MLWIRFARLQVLALLPLAPLFSPMARHVWTNQLLVICIVFTDLKQGHFWILTPYEPSFQCLRTHVCYEMNSKKWATKDDFRLLGGVLFGTKLAAQFPGWDAAPTHTYCIHIYKRWRNKYALIISPTVFFFYSTSIHAHTCIYIYVCVNKNTYIMKIYIFRYLFIKKFQYYKNY